MEIQVTARHFNASSELNENMREKIEKLRKFHQGIVGATVVLDAEKERVRRVDLTFSIPDKTIAVSAEEENMGKAIDVALERMKRQLIKENEKQKNFRAVPLTDAVTGS